MTNQNMQQKIVFSERHAEPLSEVQAMMNAVSTDAQKESNPEVRKELQSLHQWLANKVDAQKRRSST
jgi:hypothetical protein